MSADKISSHLKEQFLRDFTPSERLYFIKKAKESIIINGYVPGEDLYQYCYLITQKKRLESMNGLHSGGLVRYLLVGGRKDIEDALRIYKDRLEKTRRVVSYEECEKFTRLLEGPS